MENTYAWTDGESDGIHVGTNTEIEKAIEHDHYSGYGAPDFIYWRNPAGQLIPVSIMYVRTEKEDDRIYRYYKIVTNEGKHYLEQLCVALDGLA
jgi:hypothetical protein